MYTNREAGGPAQTAIPQPDPCAPRGAPGPSRASSRRTPRAVALPSDGALDFGRTKDVTLS